METQPTSVKKIAYNFGILLGLISIVILVFMYVANMEKSVTISTISTILTILTFVMGIKAYKKENQNFLSIKDAIKVGLAIAVIGGIISAIYIFVHYSYIYPEFIENLRDQSMIEATNKNPNMDKETMDMTIKMMNIFTSPFMLSTFSLIGSLFFGFIISLITGAIIKNERPEF